MLNKYQKRNLFKEAKIIITMELKRLLKRAAVIAGLTTIGYCTYNLTEYLLKREKYVERCSALVAKEKRGFIQACELSLNPQEDPLLEWIVEERNEKLLAHHCPFYFERWSCHQIDNDNDLKGDSKYAASFKKEIIPFRIILHPRDYSTWTF